MINKMHEKFRTNYSLLKKNREIYAVFMSLPIFNLWFLIFLFSIQSFTKSTYFVQRQPG